jgi:AGZA family xanthine/uracil permease-like MFS transporter
VPPSGSLLESYFGLRQRGTDARTEVRAGLATFMVMAYIIFVNPSILGFVGVEGLEGKGLPFDGVLASTCIVAGVMTIAMGLFTNRAYAIAPGLGINAVVAFSLVAGEGIGFPEAMGIIVMEGALVTVLVLVGMREKVMRAIPLELKKAIAIGIGLFIALIGLVDAGIVVRGEGTPITLARFTTWPVLVTLFGIVVTLVLRARGYRGDLLIGIIATTILATLVNWGTDYKAFTTPGVARWPSDVVESPNFGLIGNISFDSFATLGIVATLAWVFALFLADFFDTMGTLVGVGRQAGYLNKDGELPGIRKPLLVDSIAAMAGGAASASSATTYIESGAGVGVGGRTGWVSIVTGALFFPFMFFAPIIGMVPAQATGAALVIVGYLMITALSEYEERAEPGETATTRRAMAGIDFNNLAVGFGAMLAIVMMPFTYSITNGIGFGFIAYVIISIAQGEWRRIHPLMYVVAGLFALYFVIPLAQDQLSWV